VTKDIVLAVRIVELLLCSI